MAIERKCPYCGKEMARGYIYNGRNPVCWIPEKNTPPKLAFTKSKEGIQLSHVRSSVLSGYRAEAYYCDTCHMVLSKTIE